MVQPINRKRGGQKGNLNALKHGYYSKIFTKEEKADFCSAGSVEGIDEEIALIRRVIKTVANARDDKSLSILVRATNALNRLIRTRSKLTGGGRYDHLNDAIRNVVDDVLVPLGVDIGHAMKTKRVPEPINERPENKADLP